MTKTTILTLILGLSLALSTAASAATDDEKCEQALSIATGKYKLCMDKELGKNRGGKYDGPKLGAKLGQCVSKYTKTWPKLVKKYVGKGTSCEGDRYADNGDGTFYDRLTRLTWEKKTDDGSIHDQSNFYAWSTGSPWKADGPAFTVFLKALNDAGFAGSNGWRIPSVSELNTLIEPPYPDCSPLPGELPRCTTIPGETPPTTYLSSSPHPFFPDSVWGIMFEIGSATNVTKTTVRFVRAVSGGS